MQTRMADVMYEVASRSIDYHRAMYLDFRPFTRPRTLMGAGVL